MRKVRSGRGPQASLHDGEVRNMVLSAVYRRVPQRRGAKTPAPLPAPVPASPADRALAADVVARLRAAADREEETSSVATPKRGSH